LKQALNLRNTTKAQCSSGIAKGENTVSIMVVPGLKVGKTLCIIPFGYFIRIPVIISNVTDVLPVVPIQPSVAIERLADMKRQTCLMHVWKMSVRSPMKFVS